MAERKLGNRYILQEKLIVDPLYHLYTAHDYAENTLCLVQLLSEKARKRSLEYHLRCKLQIEQSEKLQHPNLLRPHTFTEIEGESYFVYEHFTGIPLSTIFSRSALSIDEAVEVILQTASVLEVCHQQNILHHSIKPQSILLHKNEHGITIKLFNFGLNFFQDISTVTGQKEIISIFGYLSPEGSGILRKPIDTRSDLYSLGILFFELLTGQLPYDGTDISTLIHQHIAQKAIPPSQLKPDIAPVLDKIILRLIAKDPADRYQSAAGLIADLKEYQTRRTNQRSTSEVEREVIDFEIARQDRLKELNFSTRLIGRDTELQSLKANLKLATEGQGSINLVYGEPGIGKSRLIDELRGHIYELHGIFAGGKCYQYEFRTPYKVISEVVESYIEKVKRQSQQAQQIIIKRIKEALGELGGEAVKIAPNLKDLIGEPPALVPLDATEKEKIRFLITVTNFILSLSSKENPLLLFLDDLQWVDDGSLEILERVIPKVPESALTLIIGYRSNEVDKNHALSKMLKKLSEITTTSLSKFPINPFDLTETAKMISQIILESEEHVRSLAENLYERTKGNPFFTLELLRTLYEEKIIYLQDNHYLYDREQLGKASLPTNVVDIVLKRMKDIPEEDKNILSYASVIGKEIDLLLLGELTHKPLEQLLNPIEASITNQLLYRDITGQENIYFIHDKVREAFYQRITPEERSALHQLIGFAIEEQNKANIDAVIFDLAHHFTQGNVEEKALEYSLKAGKRAQGEYANNLAINLYHTAKEILERQNKTTTQYIECLENLGGVYRLAGKLEDALETFQICESLIPISDKIHRALVISKIGETLWDSGKTEESSVTIEKALEILGIKFHKKGMRLVIGILRELFVQILHTIFSAIFIRKNYLEDTEKITIVRLLYRLAYFYFFTDVNVSFYITLRYMNIIEKVGPCHELAAAYINSIAIWSSFPVYKKMGIDFKKGIELARKLNNKIIEGRGLVYSAILRGYYRNRCAVAQEELCRSIAILRNTGEYWDLGLALAWEVDAGLVTGKFNEKTCRVMLSTFKDVNALQPLGWAYGMNAEVAVFIGRITEEEIGNFKICIEMMEKVKDLSNILWYKSKLSWAYSRRKEFSQAIKTFEEVTRDFKKYYNKGNWSLDLLTRGAQVYLDAITGIPKLPKGTSYDYLKRAETLILKARIYSLPFLFPYFRGWTYQVWGTYNWLRGRRKRAERIWDKGLHWLRTNKNNPGGDKYRIAYILLEEARFLLEDEPRGKKAYENLLEAKELFESMGCVLDLKTTTELLARITTEAEQIDSREALTSKRHLGSLLSTTAAIGSIFNLEELLSKIMEYAIKVTGAERGFLFLNQELSTSEVDSRLELKVSHGVEEGLKGQTFSHDTFKVSLNLLKEVQSKKKALIATPEQGEETARELKNYGIREAIVVPLISRDKDLGLIYLDNQQTGGTFTQDEQSLMESFAVQASVSIENARLVSAMVEQERLKQELALGKEIQESLLPKAAPQIEGLQLTGLMIPAKEIGGDYYDYILQMPDTKCQIPDKSKKLAVVIGDVSGKGVGAGLIMATAKATLKGLSQQALSPKETLVRTNRLLHEYTQEQKFMTMLYMEWDSQQKKMRYSSAGHEHILIRRNDTGAVEVIPSGGIVLGMLPEIEEFLEEKEIALNAGDKIVLYTDGITEAHNSKGELFSLERLIESCGAHGHKTIEELLASIKEDVYNFIGSAEQFDDITLVVMEAN